MSGSDSAGEHPPAPNGAPSNGSPSNGAPAPSPPEDAITLSRAALQERVERGVRQFLKRELGVETPEALKAEWSKKAELERADEERRQAAMTEQQRLQAALEAERSKRESAESQAEQARVDLHLARLFARHGVANVDYATWRIMDKLASIPETEDLDEEKFLTDELLKDPRERIALGVDREVAPPPPRQVSVPANTTQAINGQSQPKPPPAGTPEPPKSAYDLDAAAWQRRKSELGI